MANHRLKRTCATGSFGRKNYTLPGFLIKFCASAKTWAFNDVNKTNFNHLALGAKMNTSRKLLLAGAAAIAATAVASSAFAQNTANASANASVTIISPITITHTGGTDLSFGRYVMTAAGVGGSITVGPAGTVTASSGVTAVPGANSTVTAATFKVGGQVGQAYNIALSSSGTLSDTGGDTMTIGTLTSNPSGSSTLASNADPLAVGATLTVPADAPAGTYTGTVTATVTYQ